MSDMKLFSGNSNPALAKAVAKHLGAQLGKIEVGKFSEGEIRVKFCENIRGADIFLLQSTCPPVNDGWMELLIMIDAARRASARRITAVIPYYSYARQDRKDQPRVPITAKLVANLLEAAGVNRVLTMDLHADQIQGFFDIPLDHLMALPVFVKHMKSKNIKKLAVATADVGGIKSAWVFAERLGAPLAIVDKRRLGPVETKVMHVIGDVKGFDVIIPDDIIASGSSLAQASVALKERGARDIYACATHGIFSGPATERLSKAPIKEIIVSDTIPLNRNAMAIKGPKLTVLSVAPLFGEAIRRINKETSVSSLLR